MRILVVGGEGTVGRAAANHLRPRHDVLTAGRCSGDFRVDVNDELQ
jgi:nucleoside-diphosphate-sugar epimerase